MGWGPNFFGLAPFGGELLHSHMTTDITSCFYDVTSCMRAPKPI